MTVTLPRSTPSDEGVDAAGIAAFLDQIDSASDIELHSLMILRHGRVIAEGWWAPYGPDRAHLLYSLSKSFTSTAAGFAAAEGLLDLDAPVVSYFPEFADDITDERSRRMLVRHVLAMASGHAAETLDRAVAADPDEPVRGFLLTPPDAEPGSIFAYNQPCTYSVGTIVQKTSGQTLSDFLRPRLFEPLGIEGFGWIQQPPGRDLGFSGLHARTADIAHLGQLYLQGGRWGDQQLLSPDWVAEATRRHVDNPAEPNPDWRQGYGFQFWMARHGYRGDGAYGQFCVVLPEQDLVIATTAQTENMQGILDAVWAHVLPAVDAASVSGGGAPDGTGGNESDERLAERLRGVALDPLTGDLEGGPDGERPVIGESPQSPATLRAVRLDRDDDGWWLELVDDGGPVRGRVGADRWEVTEEPAPIAVSGGWVGDRFRADVIFLETPHRLRVECGPESATARWQTVPLHSLPLSWMRVPRS